MPDVIKKMAEGSRFRAVAESSNFP